MFLCVHVCAFVSREISWLCFFPTHLQCLINSRKHLDERDEKRKRGRGKDSRAEREMTERKSERMIERVCNRCIQCL